MNDAAIHRQVLVQAINVAKRLRPLRDAAVDELAESMSQTGLINPITITYPGGRVSPFLVTGAHRLEAARRLKWETIDCTVVGTANEDAARLMEVDENLVRASLTAAERALHIKRRKEIYERLHPETKHGGAPGKAGGGKKAKKAESAAFDKDTAAKTGRSRRAVRADATRAKHIPQIAEVAGTSLDKGTELDALAKLPPEQQASLIAMAVAGEAVSAKPAVEQGDPPAGYLTSKQLYGAIMEDIGAVLLKHFGRLPEAVLILRIDGECQTFFGANPANFATNETPRGVMTALLEQAVEQNRKGQHENGVEGSD